jgi:hypothetical protein
MSKELRTKVRKIIKEYYDFYPDFFDPLSNPNVHGFIGRKEPEGLKTVSMNEDVIEEGAKGFMDIPPYVGLVNSDEGFRSSSFSLFDFKNKKCIGYISLSEFSERSYCLVNIAAEPGYGPLMTEVGMMGVYNKGVCVDRNGPTKQKVWDMLKTFADSRGDIRKVKILPSDMEYDGRYPNDEDRDYVMNLIFYRTPSAWYKKLLDRGGRLSSEAGMNSTDIRNVCRDYFSSRYGNE